MPGCGRFRRFAALLALDVGGAKCIVLASLWAARHPLSKPYRANIYRQDTISGAYIMKNRFLKAKLAELGLDTEEVWADLIAHDGPFSIAMIFRRM